MSYVEISTAKYLLEPRVCWLEKIEKIIVPALNTGIVPPRVRPICTCLFLLISVFDKFEDFNQEPITLHRQARRGLWIAIGIESPFKMPSLKRGRIDTTNHLNCPLTYFVLCVKKFSSNHGITAQTNWISRFSVWSSDFGSDYRCGVATISSSNPVNHPKRFTMVRHE